DVEPVGDLHEVRYPAFRTDVKHQVDIFEDLAIGYGYSRIPSRLVRSMTIGKARPEEIISQTAREVLTGLGLTEIMSLNLYSEERQYDKFRMEPDQNHLVVSNPKTVDQAVIRGHMMAGIMETFHKNKRKSVPQRIFEIGNIISINPDAETRTEEFRHLICAIIGPQAGFADIRAVVDSLMRELDIAAEYSQSSHPAFLAGRCASMKGSAGQWGIMGEIHPEVLNNFSLAYPVSLCEICLIRVI
ncbi:hypothetical protein ACFLTD_01830, partial [Elusimicrobiota bacterium]